MDVVIYREPCWLLEAAELVYSLVNQVPPEKLTAAGPYCIPPEDVAAIQASACSGVSPDDPSLQYYFNGVPLEGEFDRSSCLGCSLLYSSMELAHPDVDDMVAALSKNWHSLRQENYRIDGINGYSLSLEQIGSGKYLSLSQEIGELQVPQHYQMQLLEAFLTFDESLAKVAALLRPVAEALPSLMEPYVQRASALLDEWEAFFQTSSAAEFIFQRARLRCENYHTLEMALRYFSPLASPGKFRISAGTIRFHMGVAVSPKTDIAQQALPEDWEFAALRLIANPVRARMLQAMVNEPMTLLELSKKLGLNHGTAFRDLNSLYNARLLLKESIGSKNCYRTNTQMLHTVSDRLLQYIEQSSTQMQNDMLP